MNGVENGKNRWGVGDTIDRDWLYRWDGGYGWRQRISMEVGDMAYFLIWGLGKMEEVWFTNGAALCSLPTMISIAPSDKW